MCLKYFFLFTLNPFLGVQLLRNLSVSLKNNLSEILKYLAVVTQKESSDGQNWRGMTKLSQNSKQFFN